MQQEPFTPPEARLRVAFPSVFPLRPRGIVYFPHYFNMFNGLIEDWYTEELGYNYADLSWAVSLDFRSCISNATSRSRAGWATYDLTLLVERLGRSSLGVAIVCHRDGIERLRARMVTAMMSIETRKPVPLPQPFAMRSKPTARGLRLERNERLAAFYDAAAIFQVDREQRLCRYHGTCRGQHSENLTESEKYDCNPAY